MLIDITKVCLNNQILLFQTVTPTVVITKSHLPKIVRDRY